jgi:sugar phosphate isomerase/epimerase
MSNAVKVTFLNSMAGTDLTVAVQRHRELGVSILDLKDHLFGKAVEALLPDEARRVAEVVKLAGCEVDCLSSCVGQSELTAGEQMYLERHLPALQRLLETARILKPRVVRLLAPKLPAGMDFSAAFAAFPWVVQAYQRMVDLTADAGFEILIENEIHGCLLSSPAAILSFLEKIDRPQSVRAIYDVQNLWQMGTFPSVEVVRQLSPVLGGLHLKGGRTDGGATLVWASDLETASWPVTEIVRATLALKTVPVICLNASHGRWTADSDVWEVAKRDLRFLRRQFPELN